MLLFFFMGENRRLRFDAKWSIQRGALPFDKDLFIIHYFIAQSCLNFCTQHCPHHVFNSTAAFLKTRHVAITEIIIKYTQLTQMATHSASEMSLRISYHHLLVAFKTCWAWLAVLRAALKSPPYWSIAAIYYFIKCHYLRRAGPERSKLLAFAPWLNALQTGAAVIVKMHPTHTFAEWPICSNVVCCAFFLQQRLHKWKVTSLAMFVQPSIHLLRSIIYS